MVPRSLSALPVSGRTSVSRRGTTWLNNPVSPLSSATELVHMSTVVHNIKIAWIGAVSRSMFEKSNGLPHR
jgi:hypothetical protein